jgi:hypothetical protein
MGNGSCGQKSNNVREKVLLFHFFQRLCSDTHRQNLEGTQGEGEPGEKRMYQSNQRSRAVGHKYADGTAFPARSPLWL